MPRHALHLVLCLLLSVASLMGAEQRPNIVLILSDDHSHPFLGCYGMRNLRTPTIDRLAAEGMRFSRMFTTAPQCVPSRASIMTGRSAVACRITRFSSPLPIDEVTFPEIMRQEAGYYVGVLGREYHLDGGQGYPEASRKVFDEHGMVTFPQRFHFVDSSGQNSIPEAMGRYFDKRPSGSPYFLWVNTSDPHFAWTTKGDRDIDPSSIDVPGYLPDTPGIRADLAAHMQEIEHLDGIVKTVVDILAARAGLDNTLILFMGDNGLAFPSGKGSLYDPGLNVPLVAWWPGVIKPGGDSSQLLSGEDIAPTCLQAVGLQIPKRISGVSFLPTLRGESGSTRRFIFAERGPHGGATFTPTTRTTIFDLSRCVRSATHKLIYNLTPSMPYAPVDSSGGPGWLSMVELDKQGAIGALLKLRYFTSPRPIYELYDLASDPLELTNLAGRKDMAEVEMDLKAALQEKMILDFDYLPLPIPSEAPSKRKDAAQRTKAAE